MNFVSYVYIYLYIYILLISSTMTCWPRTFPSAGERGETTPQVLWTSAQNMTQAKARIYPCLSCVCRIRSTAVRHDLLPRKPFELQSTVNFRRFCWLLKNKMPSKWLRKRPQILKASPGISLEPPERKQIVFWGALIPTKICRIPASSSTN